ncbi:MAG TPA: DUF3151 domain-containing protein [Candidatus Dormibacteraeota bacterium]
MNNPPDRPDGPRPLAAVPVAPHGHRIERAHQTVLPEEDPEARIALEEILAREAAGSGAVRVAELKQLCARYPAFLDAWAWLAEATYADDPVTAYACARVGYHRGLDRLRRHGWGGTGQVRWAEPTNQGFLRSLRLLMIASAAIGDDEERDRCRQFLLDLDPEDGLGVGARPPLASGETVGLGELP